MNFSKDSDITALKAEMCRKSVGSETIAKGNHYYETIVKSIRSETGFILSKDTIRNFLEGKHEPQPKLLDIYSTYVLGGNQENPRTFQEFQDWHHSLSIPPSVPSKDNKWRYLIIGGLALLVVLVIWSMNSYEYIDSGKIIYSTATAQVSPGAKKLEDGPPAKNLILNLLDDFPYDDDSSVNNAEAQRIMEWLGLKKMQYQRSNAEPFYHGKLVNGCKLAIWVGTYGKRNTYGFRCDCNGTDQALENYYLEIPKPDKTTVLKQHFTNTTLVSLNGSDWYLLDSINQSLWSNPTNNQDTFLTLKTYLGDSFLESKDYDPQIINILAHRITCGKCCDIYVKLVDFNPSHRYQQAGFFIYYSEKTYPSLRMTLGFDGMVSVIKRDAKYSNTPLLGANNNLRAKAYNVKSGIIENPIDSIVLRMQIQDGQYFFSHKVNNGNFVDIMSQSLSLPRPVAIGLAAFQGRPEVPFPIYPATKPIPAKFEYAIVTPCKN
jgi:hypothetical protein